MSERSVIRKAEVGGRLVDVVIGGPTILDIVEAGRGDGGDEIIDADGGALLPGLHDHHIHLLALAAARRSVACGPPRVTDRTDLAAALATADREARSGAWIRGVGYHESVAGDLDRYALDVLVPARPVRVQHRSGYAWILNTAALDAAGIVGIGAPPGVELDEHSRPTGRIFGLDDWLRRRVPQPAVELAGVGTELASYGVTAVTDATPTGDAEELGLLAAAVARGELSLRVVVTGAADLNADVAPELERGPVKLIIADHGLPSLDRLVRSYREARDLGRCIAVHCVTRAAVVLALAAWDDVGARPGDRIEHGAVIPLELSPRIAELGLTVVTQPVFVATRGDDYLREVEPDDRPDLWRCATLRSAGVPVGGSTDAPFGDPDPWLGMAAAMDRRTIGGTVLGPAERLPATAALGLFLAPLGRPGGPPRRVAVGEPADLCLLDRPAAEVLREPSSEYVRLVLRAGAVIHRT
jgi:predicted amidohydrolase YtcJ